MDPPPINIQLAFQVHLNGLKKSAGLQILSLRLDGFQTLPRTDAERFLPYDRPLVKIFRDEVGRAAYDLGAPLIGLNVCVGARKRRKNGRMDEWDSRVARRLPPRLMRANHVLLSLHFQP